MNQLRTAAVCALLGLTTASQAKPAPTKQAKVGPQPRWEYAFIKNDWFDKSGAKDAQGYALRGVEILYPTQHVFLPYGKNSNKDEFFLDVLNRMGSNGWELVNVPGYEASRRYVLKRRK